MTADEIIGLYLPVFSKIIGGGCRGKDDYRLEDALQIPCQPCDYKPMPEDIRRLLTLLGGPHGKTILKILEIRRGDETQKNRKAVQG